MRSPKWPGEKHEILHLRTRALAGRGCGRRGAHPRRQVHRGRHQSARLDEAGDRNAGTSDRRERPCARQDPTHARGWAAHRRAGAQHRSRRRSARAAGLWPAVARAGRRRLGPVAQHGHDGWQPAPAHPLPVFLRHQHAMQQTRARQRLLGNRRGQPPACRCRRQRRLHRHASERHGRGTARSRRQRGNDWAGQVGSGDPHRRLSSFAGQYAAHRDRADAGRADHGSHPAPPGRRHAHLSQGARPRVFCICFGFGRCNRPARRHGARGIGRRGTQALACRSGRSRDATWREGRHDAAARGARTTPENAFKLPLVERTLGAVLDQARS
jgi:hypothetical protein